MCEYMCIHALYVYSCIVQMEVCECAPACEPYRFLWVHDVSAVLLSAEYPITGDATASNSYLGWMQDARASEER